MSSTKTIAATAAALCLTFAGSAPAQATTDHAGSGSLSWTEPDAGQLIAQLKERAASRFSATYDAARRPSYNRTSATFGAVPTQRPCAKYPDLCGIPPT